MINLEKIIDDNIKNLSEPLKFELLELIQNTTPFTKTHIKTIIATFKKEHGIIAIGKFTKRYWQSRGWSDDETLKLIKLNQRNKSNLISPLSVKYWENKINPITGNLFTSYEIDMEIKKNRKPNKEYWESRGYSESEAIYKVSEFQQSLGNKFSHKNKENPDHYKNRTSTQLGYWINRGYTEEDARKQLGNRQNVNSLNSFINRYGEELGATKYYETNKKIGFANTIEYYINKYGEIDGPIKYIKKYSMTHPFTSVESINYFIPLYKYLRINGLTKADIYWGITGAKEYYLSDTSTIFFYDFTIPKLRKIIEYNGTAFHPNPKWPIDKLNNWSCPFSKLSANDKLRIDEIKCNLAKTRGFDIISIWNDDLPDLTFLINFIYDKRN